MREIKFRAWGFNNPHMKEKTMFIPFINEFNDVNDGLDNLQADDIVLMQYTGLKDKNGVDIYEGDIIKVYNGNIFKIVFFGGAFRVAILQERVKIVMNADVLARNKDGEVIGNIYENKGMLDV